MPWPEFEDLHQRMGRLLENLTGGFNGAGSAWAPALDLEETDDAYLAEIDLPGINKDDLSVELVGDQVRVHGEIKQRERTGILRRQTRRVGVVDYAFTVPGEVEQGKVSAELKDGVLTVHMPKAAGSQPIKVKVN
jgi:HSP20 family protein